MVGGGSSVVVLEVAKIRKISYNGGLHLLSVDVDGYPAGA
jgi:hypothetical protein